MSRHLGLLKDAGLVSEEKDAGFTYYRLAPTLERERASRALGGAQGAVRQPRPSDPAVQGRRGAAAGSAAAAQGELRDPRRADARDARQLVPGRSWAAWSRALGLLLPPLRVADLGCGEGYLTIEASRWAARVIAVDRSEVVLDRARALGLRRRVVERRVEARRAREAADQGRGGRRGAAVAGAASRRRPGARRRRSGAHHRAGRPGAGARPAASIAKSGSATKLGDRRLGFSEDELESMLADAGLREPRVGVGASKAGDPFTVLIASGQKPRSPRSRAAGETARLMTPDDPRVLTDRQRRPHDRSIRSRRSSRAASPSSTARWARPSAPTG